MALHTGKYKARDPLALFLREWGSRETFGQHVDGDPIESPKELQRELSERLTVLSREVCPRLHGKDAPHVRAIVRAMGADDSLIRRILSGKASAANQRKYIVLLMQHIQGAREHLVDLLLESMVLFWVAHDPRLRAHKNRSAAEKQGEVRQRQALHTRREALAKGKKPPTSSRWIPRYALPRERD